MVETSHLIVLLCSLMAINMAIAYLSGWRQFKKAVTHQSSSPAMRTVLTIGMETNRRLHVMEWIMQYCPSLVRSVGLLYGNRGHSDSDEMVHLWAGKISGLVLFMLFCSLLLGAVLQDAALAGIGAFLSLCLPFAVWRDLERKMKERHRFFLTDLPAFVHKMSLLIGAGETVQGAWIRASSPPPAKMNHPLYSELRRMRNELAQSIPFGKALELFSQRCGIPEVNFLVTTTLMNYRRGGETFALLLQQTGRAMIEKKRSVMKTMGEEATTKMVFPMVLIFAVIMAVVAAPAVMMMNQGL